MKVQTNSIVMRIAAIMVVLTSGIFALNAQVTARPHWPHNGDRVTKTHYEFVEMPADTTVWDFSHAIETGGSHEMRWVNMGDSILVRIERGAQFTYTMHGDSIWWRSQENALLGVRDSVAPVIVCDDIVSLGDSISSPYYFRGKYSGNNAVDMKGRHSMMLMSMGTLIIPNDTIDDVVRVREITDGAMKVSANATMAPIEADETGLLRHTVVTDRWYVPECRYEIAENVSSIYTNAGNIVQESHATFLCTPDAQELALGRLPKLDNAPLRTDNRDHAPKHGNGLSLSDRITVNVNETGIDVLVSGNGGTGATDADASLILSDISGRVWASQRGSTSGGAWTTSVDTSPIPSGTYILYMSSGEETTSQRIQIKYNSMIKL